MSAFLEKVRILLLAGEVRISEHGYDELAEDGLSVREVLEGHEKPVVLVTAYRPEPTRWDEAFMRRR